MHAGLRVPWLNEMKDVCEKILERSLHPCFQCLLHAITVCTDLLVHHLASGISGTKLTCVLATMANRSKEDSELEPHWGWVRVHPGNEASWIWCPCSMANGSVGAFSGIWCVGHEPCARWGLPINPNGTFTCMAGWCSGVERRKVTTCFWLHLKWYEQEECQKPCSPMKLSPSLNQLKKLNGLIKWGWTRQRVQHNVALKYGTPCTSSCWPAARPSRNMPNHWWGQGMRWWSVTCTCTVEIMGWVPAHWCQILQQTMLSFGTSWWNSRTRNLSQLHYGVRRGFQAICATSGSSTKWSCSQSLGQWFQHWRQRSLLLGCVFC